MRFFVSVLAWAILCCFFCELCFAQQTIPLSPKTIRDSKGRDFWIGFPRNHHDRNSPFDRVYIHIAAERATRGKIEYRAQGRLREVPFSIPANDIVSFDFDYIDAEIAQLSPTKQSFHITADEEVTVYGLNLGTTTSDAFLAFPTDVLGREHVIASYQSNILFQGNTGRVNTGTSTMSQFAVLATQDSTFVTITPTVKTWNGDSTTYSLRLQQGEIYLVSMYPTEDNAFKDFTGSRVLASKPVVVYGGHERAAIPITGNASRDHLVEQMLPVEVWGKTALVAPYPRPGLGSPDFSLDIVRVIAGYDSTVVFVNSVTSATL